MRKRQYHCKQLESVSIVAWITDYVPQYLMFHEYDTVDSTTSCSVYTLRMCYIPSKTNHRKQR